MSLQQALAILRKLQTGIKIAGMAVAFVISIISALS